VVKLSHLLFDHGMFLKPQYAKFVKPLSRKYFAAIWPISLWLLTMFGVLGMGSFGVDETIAGSPIESTFSVSRPERMIMPSAPESFSCFICFFMSLGFM